MSWSFEHKGQHAAVQKKILAELYLPVALKTAIVEVVGLGSASFNAVSVKTAGHTDANGSGTVYELKIEQLNFLLNPVVAPETPNPSPNPPQAG